MRIDISRPDGNTFAAMGVAAKFLQACGFSQEYIDDMRRAVFKAGRAAEARGIIEERTGGAITFYDSRRGP